MLKETKQLFVFKMERDNILASRLRKLCNKKAIIILVIAVALTLNMITFVFAYPEMFKPSSPTLARDFSAYYIAGWRLFHNPTKVYAGGSQQGDYQILPKPQTFKYAPSFLILISPFLSLSYQNAFIAFNFVQLALMPVLGFFVYKLVKDKNLILAVLACVVVLLDPLPSLPINQAQIQLLHYRFTSINLQTFSWGYYWGWVCGNAHILQPILLIGAMYFGVSKKPWLSALMFAFGSFDPRFALMALPLIVWYNRKTISAFTVGTIIFLSTTNLPFFLYYGIGFAFLNANLRGSIISQMYAYDWIPFYSIIVLTLVEMVNTLSKK
jgi:hypothetical protein